MCRRRGSCRVQPGATTHELIVTPTAPAMAGLQHLHAHADEALYIPELCTIIGYRCGRCARAVMKVWGWEPSDIFCSAG